MPKVKIPRKSTNIDMTAMCDVAFLLLTFFMLTTKFKTDNPILVDLPSSISEIKLPERDLVQVAISYNEASKVGRIFFSLDGQPRRETLLQTLFDKKFVSLDYSATYDKDHNIIQLSPNVPPDLKDKIIKEFSLETNIDVSLKRLPIWLQLNAELREQLKNQIEKENKVVNLRYPDGKIEKFDTGIDTTVTTTADADGKDKRSSDLILLTYYTRTLDIIYARNHGLLKSTSKIAIRGDARAPYPFFKKAIDALQDADELQYYLITNLKAKPR
jgi:biopolymer transport protein ExbD